VSAGLVLSAAAGHAQQGQAPWRAQLESLGIEFLSAPELKAMLDGREDVVLIDARDPASYAVAHIPGAISIPAEDTSIQEVDVRRPRRLTFPDRLPADRGRRLVFYCAGPT
jgi:rhodanese-related sulfurtransferase